MGKSTVEVRTFQQGTVSARAGNAQMWEKKDEELVCGHSIGGWHHGLGKE